MASRIVLDVDILQHINDLTFHVYRSTEPIVTDEDMHIMDVIQNLTVKERKWETGEILNRDPQTPYAFYVRRHYETDITAPQVKLGSTAVDLSDLHFLPVDKQIEIHSGDIGLFDGRPVYMDYEYTTQPLTDDPIVESGKVYFGPVATGLRMPMNFRVVQDFIQKKFHLQYDYDYEPMAFYYRIFAQDTMGNTSPWSDTKMLMLAPDDVFFRVQKSADGEAWEEVTLTTMIEWLDGYSAIDNPINVSNAEIRPLTSKSTEIAFDNPWLYFKNYVRTSETYRIRAEDEAGQHTEWVVFGPLDTRFEPKEIVIRRKLDNKSVSSKEGLDAFTVFRLDKSKVSKTAPRIVLIDDQLTDKSKYAYTFFYEDELDKSAAPFYLTSDHRPWLNIILFAGNEQRDIIEDRDFMSTFEWADRVIEIGAEEGQ